MDGITTAPAGAPAPVRSSAPPPSPPPARQTPERKASATSSNRQQQLEDLKAQIAELSKTHPRTDVSVQLDAENSNEPVIVVTDHHTGEVLREFPPSELRRMKQLLADIGGLFIDREA